MARRDVIPQPSTVYPADALGWRMMWDAMADGKWHRHDRLSDVGSLGAGVRWVRCRDMLREGAHAGLLDRRTERGRKRYYRRVL